jgi:DNA-directed RNA polymerase subunit E'/Rpb7
MGKRDHNETKEQRKERKRAKKEAKKAAKQKDGSDDNTHSNTDALLASPASRQSAAVSPTASSSSTAFQEKRLKMLVSLYPIALNNVLGSVREALRRSLLLKFSDGVGGVLLGFNNVSFSESKQLGMILNELPQIHYTVELDALVFCPKVGSKLTGVVNECFPSHVGMLVHSFFNAMISSDHLQSAGYVFNPQSQQWTDESDSKVLGNEDKVDFVLEKIHECDGIISMEGSNPRVC